jgi:uncharacterized protein YukE
VQRRLAIAALALCLGLAACGGDGGDDFKDDYRPLNDQVGKLDSDMRRALSRVRSRSDLQIEKQFGQFAQRAGDLQQEVDELEPPDDAKGEQADLTEALGDVQEALEDIERAADDNDATAARSAAIQLVTSITEMRTARRKLATEAEL